MSEPSGRDDGTGAPPEPAIVAFARRLGDRALRAARLLALRVLPAAPIAIGTALVGLAVIVGVLDALVNRPQSLDDLVLLPQVGIAFGAGAALVLGFGALELKILDHERDALIALAVGVGLIATAMALIAYVFIAAGILSPLGNRGGLPESLGAAWATLILIATLVAGTLFLTMR